MYISVFKSPDPKIFRAFAYPSAPTFFHLGLLPSQRGSLVLLPSLALVTMAHRSSRRLFCTPSNPWCKVISAERTSEPWWPKPCTEKERPKEKRAQAGDSQAPKNSWDSTYKCCMFVCVCMLFCVRAFMFVSVCVCMCLWTTCAYSEPRIFLWVHRHKPSHLWQLQRIWWYPSLDSWNFQIIIFLFSGFLLKPSRLTGLHTHNENVYGTNILATHVQWSE